MRITQIVNNNMTIDAVFFDIEGALGTKLGPELLHRLSELKLSTGLKNRTHPQQ
jgi:hypothetical protein